MTDLPTCTESSRVAYHWSKTPAQGGGIGRYVRTVRELLSTQQIVFQDMSETAPAFLGRFKHAFCLARDLIFPWLNINRDVCDVYWGVAHRLPLFRVAGVLYVVTVHDLVWKICPSSMPLMRRLSEMFLFPIALRRADVILAVSNSTYQDIIKYFPKYECKVKVTHLGSEPIMEIDAASHCDRKRYFLFVGTIEPRKNISTLLEAFALLPDSIRKNYKLVIVGSKGWGGVKITEMIHKLGLVESVHVTGYVNDSELDSLYRNSYCLIMPSLYEGFGLPIVEAQKHGVPVITSNISSMPEVAGDGALLVDPRSAESIASAIERLSFSDALHEELSLKAFANAQQFSWERTASLTRSAFVEPSFGKEKK